MSPDAALVDYYHRRAAEYDRVYAKPERQNDLAYLHTRIPALLRGRHVYEFACGTGYWTARLAATAASVVAIDLDDAVLAIAGRRSAGTPSVVIQRGDAFAPPSAPHVCDGGLAAFWWSHLRRPGEPAAFVAAACRVLGRGARLVLLDNRYVEGSSTPVTHHDAHGNTYQQRSLDDGSVHRVLKNFPSEAQVRADLAPAARTVTWETTQYYWLAVADLW